MSRRTLKAHGAEVARRLLADRNISVVDMAAALGHLAREGQTFSRIVDDVRLKFAQRYVKQPRRSLTEISPLLGFSAPSASRWHRRHFGAKASTLRTRGAARARHR